jgi:alkyl sulfatase BDS1-like metallo-beta-lactamase superfamily hydrolase
MAENATHNLQTTFSSCAARWCATRASGPATSTRPSRGYLDAGDPRVAAELPNHAVFADPGAADAKALRADVYGRLGFGAENGTWRNFCLTGARELRHGLAGGAQPLSSAGMASALTIEQLFDSIAIRVNGPKAWDHVLTIDSTFTDEKRSYRMELSNGALVRWPDPGPDDADLSLTLSKPQLLGMLAGKGLDGIDTTGNPAVLRRRLGLLDEPDPEFAIVTP